MGRLHLATLALFAALPLAGCYTYAAPLADRPAPGAELAITLNDRGRVDLEPQLGPEVWQVEGTLVGADDSSLALSMLKTSTLEHSQMRWAGEVVRFRTDQVRTMEQRRFSPTRTVLLAGTATASVVVFLATHSLLGFGSGPGGPVGGNGGSSTQ